MDLRWAKPGRILAALVLVAVAGHLAWMSGLPAPRFWGDEGHYLALATAEAEDPGWSLLPGTFGFDHRPLLNVRLLSLFAPEVYPRIALLNLLLLVVLVLCTYGSARQLGLSSGASLGAAGFLALFPWIGFHFHSLWPEVLHMALVSVVLLLFLRFFETARPGLLVGAGVATAYALFTKGSLQPFLVLFFASLVWRFVRPPGTLTEQLKPAGVAILAFGLPLAALVLPQLLVNRGAGHGMHLAANRWWNLEAGLTTSPEHKLREVDHDYLTSSRDEREREAFARERTLAYVSKSGLVTVVRTQLAKLWKLLSRKRSGFERSLHEFQRWGEPPPPLLRILETPARVGWYLLWGLGLLGLALLFRRGLGWSFCALFLCAYLVALAAVPVKIRFALPVVPLLTLFAAGACDELRRRSRRGPAPQRT